MTTLIIIFIGCVIGFYFAMTDTPSKTTLKRGNKPRRHSVWDDDPFFGTPLQKID